MSNLTPTPTDLKTELLKFRIKGLPEHFYYIPDIISREEEASILQKIPAQRWTHLTHRRLQAHPSTLTHNNVLLAAPLPTYLTSPVVQRFQELGIFDDTPHHSPNHVLINEYKPGEGIMPHEDGGAYAPVVATVSLGGALCLEITKKPESKVENGEGANLSLKDDDRGNAEAGENGDEALPSNPQFNIPTRIFQEPRSLLITTGAAYTDLLHGIAHIDVDEHLGPDTVANWSLLAAPNLIQDAGGRNVRTTRVSLTYRDVLKVSAAASKVFGGLSRK